AVTWAARRRRLERHDEALHGHDEHVHADDDGPRARQIAGREITKGSRHGPSTRWDAVVLALARRDLPGSCPLGRRVLPAHRAHGARLWRAALSPVACLPTDAHVHAPRSPRWSLAWTATEDR